MPPSDVFVIESGGGGGWGDPRRRTTDACAADLDPSAPVTMYRLGIDVGGTPTR